MKSLSPEEQILLACTRQCFSETHRHRMLELCRRTTIRWDRVYAIAHRHNVLPLIYTNLQRCPLAALGMPSSLVTRFNQRYLHQIAIMTGQASRFERKLAFFKARSMAVMLIKGAALALLVYDQPWYTVHDLDVVIKPGKMPLTCLMQAQIHTLFADLPGLEYDFFEHHDVMMNGMLPVDFEQIWADSRTISYGAETVVVMSAEDMLITSCLNSCRKRFFRLKSLFDIAEIIERTPTLNWNEFVRKTNQYRCANIVYTALVATGLTLGGTVPDQVLAALAINPLRAALIRYVSRRLSFSTLASLFSGLDFYDAPLGPGLILPYLTYTPGQLWLKFTLRDQFWRTAPP
jgi:hypothetical protein